MGEASKHWLMVVVWVVLTAAIFRGVEFLVATVRSEQLQAERTPAVRILPRFVLESGSWSQPVTGVWVYVIRDTKSETCTRVIAVVTGISTQEVSCVE